MSAAQVECRDDAVQEIASRLDTRTVQYAHWEWEGTPIRLKIRLVVERPRGWVLRAYGSRGLCASAFVRIQYV